MMRLSFILFTMFSVSSYGASTGTLVLSGDVSVINDITVTPAASATTLDIVGGETATNVASVVEQSNNLAGYTIQIYSSNAGFLVNTSDATKSTAYQLSYDGGAMVTPPASGSPLTVKTVSSLNGLTTATSQVDADVTAYATAPAGQYTDTVTLSIVAN